MSPGMFAISWLDLRRLPVRIDDVGLDAQYVSAAIQTDGVMLWFILDESGLHLRCRYPDTREGMARPVGDASAVAGADVGSGIVASGGPQFSRGTSRP